MKKGIDYEWATDPAGYPVLRIRKERGRLSLDDIIATATEAGQDYYGLVLKCMDEDMSQYYEDDIPGDCVELYEIDKMLELIGRARAI